MAEHIKMPNVTPIVRYNAGGAQTVFEFPFAIFASEDLSVYIDGAKQASGYTVQNAGKTNGGSVIFDVAPPKAGVLLHSREIYP